MTATRLPSAPMNRSTRRKCLHCCQFFLPDHRNRSHQLYCSKAACRKQSKAQSQRRWLQRPENQNYFRCQENSQRIREWRKHSPGYWRKKNARRKGTLQEVCEAQVANNEKVTKQEAPNALQDLFSAEPALFVGLISTMTGSALQDDIVATARLLRTKGQQILSRNMTAKP